MVSQPARPLQKKLKKKKKNIQEELNGLKITIDANKKIVNFLDVTLNLTNGSYNPYMNLA